MKESSTHAVSFDFMPAMLRKPLYVCALLLFLSQLLSAAVYQWSVPEGNGRAFLWVPENCTQLRAVVVAQNNMLEERVLEHPAFRKELSDLGIGIVWVAPAFEGGTMIEQGAGERLKVVLNTLAQISGYHELATAPVVPMGHSACATFPWNYAAAYPERTLAVLSIHGDAPQTHLTGNGKPRMDWDGRRINGIPGLFVMAEYEWMDERMQPGLEFRRKFPQSCIAMLAEPGEGHFDASDDLVGYLGMFLRKAAVARLPENPGSPLKAVDSSKGWLVQHWSLREGRTVAPAPVASYKGDAAEAFWAFDEEMALATQHYHAEHVGKKPQLVGYQQKGVTVVQLDIHQQVTLEWLPEKDGVSFSLQPVFLSKVEAGSKNLSRWTGLPVESPLGHSTTETTIVRITGPVAELGGNRFSLSLNRTSSTLDKRNTSMWFAARNPGDGDYAPAVQQALLPLPVYEKGKPQIITFPELQDITEGESPPSLAAVSDSGLKVRYFVREGPAEVVGDQLRLTPIPPKAGKSIKVTVVAWQYGTPQYNTASLVERSFSISTKKDESGPR